MTAPHSTKDNRIYHRKRKQDSRNDSCAFCDIKKGDTQYVRETDHFKVMRNRMPYSLWDTQGVVDHLMIVPKIHTDTLKDFSAKMAVEYVALVGEYESKGYNVYARAPGSKRKSVEHQHTHLIQSDGRNRRFLLMIRRPFYIRLSR